MTASQCFGCPLECWGYALGVTNMLKCILIIGISSYLIETADQKALEYSKHNNSTLAQILREIQIYSGLTLGTAIVELVILIVLVCGVNMVEPCMLLPWILCALITFILAFVKFIRILMKKEQAETVVLVSNIVSMFINIISIIIIIKLYKWLRHKKNILQQTSDQLKSISKI